MEQETADKLLGTYNHLLTLVTISTVSILKCDKATFDFHNTMVGNGNTMCITAKVVEYFLRSIKRCFGVNNPLFFPEFVD